MLLLISELHSEILNVTITSLFWGKFAFIKASTEAFSRRFTHYQ